MAFAIFHIDFFDAFGGGVVCALSWIRLQNDIQNRHGLFIPVSIDVPDSGMSINNGSFHNFCSTMHY